MSNLHCCDTIISLSVVSECREESVNVAREKFSSAKFGGLGVMNAVRRNSTVKRKPRVVMGHFLNICRRPITSRESVYCLLVTMQVLFARRWTNVSVQQVQPNVCVTEAQRVQPNDGVSQPLTDSSNDERCLSFTSNEAFNGGGCLQFATTADGSRRVTR